MDNTFYSKPNFYLLKSIACKAIQTKYNYTLRDEYDSVIVNIMQQTKQKVKSCPPHIDQQVYTKELNKRVLDLIVTNIHKQFSDRNTQPVQVVHPPVTQSLQDITKERELAAQMPNQVNYNSSIGNYSNPNLEYPAAVQDRSQNFKTDINQIPEGSTSIEQIHAQTRGLDNHMNLLNNVIEKNESNDLNTNMNNFPTTNMDNNMYTNMHTDLETNTNNFNVHNQNIASTDLQPRNDTFNNAQNIIDLQKNVNYTLERNNQILIESSDGPHKLFHDVNAKNQLDQMNATANNASHSFPIITPTKTSLIERFEYITIDSRDRDLSRFPNTNHFEIKFSPVSDSFDIPTYLDKHNLVRWGTAVKYHGDDKGASIGVSYDNVLSVECVQALYPGELQPAWGRYPSSYTGNTNATPFQPIYDGSSIDVGIQTSVSDEPYLFLYVEELDGPYRGTNIAGENAFTKLIHDGFFGVSNIHIQMKPVDGEYKLYTPTTLGKLNKMTVRVNKHNNLPFNFGTDKTYISAITSETLSNINYCHDDTGPSENFVKITINKSHPDYKNSCITGHGLKPGDLIYIYSTIPHEQNFTLTNTHLVFTKNGTDDGVLGAVTYDGAVTEFDFNTLLKVGDFIKYGSTVTRITAIDSTTNDITVSGDLSTEPTTTSNFGFYKVNRRGQLGDNENAINYLDGVYVLKVDDSDNFTVNVKFDLLNDLLKTSHTDPLLINELFFIKKKMQVSYTFKVITLEKDYEPIRSDLNQ
jgi:hypothetical protein